MRIRGLLHQRLLGSPCHRNSRAVAASAGSVRLARPSASASSAIRSVWNVSVAIIPEKLGDDKDKGHSIKIVPVPADASQLRAVAELYVDLV